MIDFSRRSFLRGVLLLSVSASCGACNGRNANEPSTPEDLDVGTFVSQSGTAESRATPVPDVRYQSTGIGEVFLSSLPLHTPPEVQQLAVLAPSDHALSSQIGIEWRQRGPVNEELQRHFPQVRSTSEDLYGIDSFREILSEVAPTPPTLADSFVIDYRESEIEHLLQEHSVRKMSPLAIEEFVHRHIEHKTYVRQFDIASRVAAQRSGDCSEHAVLLTSLLRASGVPARVALGVVIVFTNQGALAGGHAWTEYFDGRRWIRLDAALYQPQQIAIASVPPDERGTAAFGVAASGKTNDKSQPVIRRLYLTRTYLMDEGPGFTRALTTLFIESGMDEFWVHATERP